MALAKSRTCTRPQNGVMLTAQDLHDAFMELGTHARREGKIIDLAIYGGSALLIAESPIAFRRRLIFTEAEPLRRARMPIEPPSR
jgi:hypothetical protein